jgi:hypothetical protein
MRDGIRKMGPKSSNDKIQMSNKIQNPKQKNITKARKNENAKQWAF